MGPVSHRMASDERKQTGERISATGDCPQPVTLTLGILPPCDTDFPCLSRPPRCLVLMCSGPTSFRVADLWLLHPKRGGRLVFTDKSMKTEMPPLSMQTIYVCWMYEYSYLESLPAVFPNIGDLFKQRDMNNLKLAFFFPFYFLH